MSLFDKVTEKPMAVTNYNKIFFNIMCPIYFDNFQKLMRSNSLIMVLNVGTNAIKLKESVK